VRRVPKDHVHRFGIAECASTNDGLRVLRLLEKPGPGETDSDLAVFGRYLVTPEVVDVLARCDRQGKAELQLTDGLAGLIGPPNGVWALEFSDDFYDCGTPAEYARSVARWGFEATSTVEHPR
jgi:UTP--glucose-1-phosphate uridylyltransferase